MVCCICSSSKQRTSNLCTIHNKCNSKNIVDGTLSSAKAVQFLSRLRRCSTAASNVFSQYLPKYDEFNHRHIGPNAADQAEMLKYLGVQVRKKVFSKFLFLSSFSIMLSFSIIPSFSIM